MRAGRLNKRVRIYTPPNWQLVRTSWAAIEPQRARANTNPETLTSFPIYDIRMRYSEPWRPRAEVQIHYRQRYGYNRIFIVLTVANIEERRRELWLTCREYEGQTAIVPFSSTKKVNALAHIRRGLSEATLGGQRLKSIEPFYEIEFLTSQFVDTERPRLKSIVTFPELGDERYKLEDITVDNGERLLYIAKRLDYKKIL